MNLPKARSLVALCVALLATVRTGLAQHWVATSSPATNWSCLAASADGMKVAAGVATGPVYLSTNGGVTWMESTAPMVGWSCLSSSADGSILVGLGGGFIYVSRDSGATWSLGGSFVHPTGWTGVACSADGSKMAACAWFSTIWTSFDTGTNWLESHSSNPGWWSIAQSGNGNQLLAAAGNGGGVVQSTNSGVDWFSAGLPGGDWQKVWISGDSSRMLAAGTDGVWGIGSIYISTNGGMNWTLNSLSRPENGVYWADIAVSAEAKAILAAKEGSVGNAGGYILASWNSGGFWYNTDAPFVDWTGIVCSADGTRALAAFSGGPIYALQIGTAETLPARGTGGTAIFQGLINPDGVETTAWFEWGLSPAHGNSTTPRLAGSGGLTTFEEAVTGLDLETDYYYRTAASNSNGGFVGEDRIYRAPRILLYAGYPTVLDFDEVFQDPGAYVTNGSLTVYVTGTVNTAIPGVYTLTYFATNSLGIAGTTNRTVTVRGPKSITENVSAELSPFGSGGPGRATRLFGQAISGVTRAANSNLWIDETHLVFPGGQKVFSESAKAVSAFASLGRSRPMPYILPPLLAKWTWRLIASDRLLATTAVSEAMQAGVPYLNLKGALKSLEAGHKALNAGKAASAISAYGAAWEKAMKAMSKL